MSLLVTAGRIEIKGPDGVIALDTDERMFHATDFKAGSVTRPARSVAYSLNSGGQEVFTPVNVFETVNLGAIHAEANAVVGMFKVTGTAEPPPGGTQGQAGNGVLNFGWFAAGGSYVHACLPQWAWTGTRWINNVGGLISTYTFEASGGQLILREGTQGHPGQILTGTGTINLSQGAITLDYKLYVGTYT